MTLSALPANPPSSVSAPAPTSQHLSTDKKIQKVAIRKLEDSWLAFLFKREPLKVNVPIWKREK